MKILHVVHAYAPSRGGCQWLVQQLAERQVRDYGDEVTVFTTVADDLEHFWRRDLPALPAGTEVINGVTVRRFPVFNHLRWIRVAAASLTYRMGLPFNDWFRTIQTGPIMSKMTRAIATSDADVVVATGFPLLHMYYAGWGARRANKPLVLIGALHTDDIWGYERKSIFNAIQKADAYVALTPFERSYLMERGIPEAKIHVIGAGVDLEPYAKADGEACRQKYGWGSDPVVCAIGKFVARKRYDFLLAAMIQVWQHNPNVRLVIAGGYTDYLDKFKEMIRALPAHQQDQITILPDVSEEEKLDILDACTLFVLPSLHESFGIVLVEAWAAGKPVVGANSGAIASLIEDGVNGLLFEPEAVASLALAIQTLVADSSLTRKMGEQGRQGVCQQFPWPMILERNRKLYQMSIYR